MQLLNNVITVMNKEEVRNFKLWLNSTNASSARKDILLFDYIRKSAGKYDEEFIYKKLYPGDDKNSFYRLKNRLLEDIGYNLSLLHFSKHESNNLYLLLGLYNIFISRNEPDIALFYLKKAEKRALLIENFEILDIIYANFVKLSYDLTGINPEVYIRHRKENAIKLDKIRETDQALAAVTYRLKLSQNYGKRDVGLLKLLDSTIKEFAADESIWKSKTFQTRIFRAVSQILIQNHNFVELEKFMLATYQRFLSQKWFDKANHETKIQMLIYIINSTFKNHKFRESLDYAEALGEELSAWNGMLYKKFVFFYYNALVINYAKTDLARGLKALDEAEREMKDIKNSYYDFFILLNKATLLFYQRKTNDALKNLVKLYLNDHYTKTDASFKIKIAVAECIMQYESGDGEGVIKRVEQVKKQFKEQLDSDDFKREWFVMKLLPDLAGASKPEVNSKLYNQIAKFVKTDVAGSVEDGEVLRYRAWLAPKVGIESDILDE
jgi:hypothetical protein